MDRTPTRPRLSPVERVRAALAAEGLGSAPIRVFPEGTATAADAAAALGIPVARIVKSLVFMAGERAVIVLAAGPNRVDTHKLAELTSQKIRRANADQVRQATSFSIGGVPPVAHPEPLLTYCDRDLLQYDEVWAAAGTPNSVFPVDPHLLVRMTHAEVVDITERA
jgi:prolyl-tRNA editing enzyme YbaK/EbsC (Cys-tRNA(Pro) deacylase)